MKSTDNFKKVIEEKLQKMAAADESLAASMKKKGKNIDDCITYILNTVQKSGCNGFADDEIFGMAVHYYDEDNIKTGDSVNCKVVVNHTIELSENEKTKAKEEARERVINEERDRLRKKTVRKKIETTELKQQSLF